MTEADRGRCFILFPYTLSDRGNRGASSPHDERVTVPVNADAETVPRHNLHSRRAEFEKRALDGDLRAALCFAHAHVHGMGVQKGVALGRAWLLVGMHRGVDDPDRDAQHELYERWIGITSNLTSADKAEAHRLYRVMCGSAPGSDANEPSS